MNNKVQKVMHEFGSGKLKSSSGQKVSNPKQAIAIALSESRRAKRYEGGGAVETGKKQEYVRVEGDAAKAATVATKQAITAGARAERAAPQDIKNQLQDVANERAAAAFELRKKSGMAKGGIAKANTHHGKLDLPFKQLNRMAGMKGGGSVKKYAKGNIVSEKDYNASGYSTLRDYLNNQQKKTRRGETAEQNEAIQSEAMGRRNIANMAKMPAPSPSGTKDMRDVLGDRAVKQAAEDNDREMRVLSRYAPKNTQASPSSNMDARDMQNALAPSRNMDARDMQAAAANEKAAAQAAAADKEKASDAAREAGVLSRYKKGGSVKESKAMVAKEMMFMKKKGAPASMMKHEKAEAGMKKGGMARGGMKMPMSMMSKLRTPTMAATRLGAVPAMAKGGGIESKGKTKGKVIKMAAGGSVSSASRRADGIAQRGKTRC